MTNYLWTTSIIDALQNPIKQDIEAFHRLITNGFFINADIGDIHRFFSYFDNNFLVYLDQYFMTIKSYIYNEFSKKVSSPSCIGGNYKQVMYNAIDVYKYGILMDQPLVIPHFIKALNILNDNIIAILAYERTHIVRILSNYYNDIDNIYMGLINYWGNKRYKNICKINNPLFYNRLGCCDRLLYNCYTYGMVKDIQEFNMLLTNLEPIVII